MLARDCRNIQLTGADILSTLDHNGAHTQFYKFQCREEPGRTGTHYNHRGAILYIAILAARVLVYGRLFVYKYPDCEIHVYCTLARIDAAAQHTHGGNSPCIEPFQLCNILLYRLLVGSNMRLYSYLIFIYHR